MNRLRVIEMLYRQPGSSRTDLARWTGLSRATVSALVEELGHAGVVEEHEGPRQPTAPRPTGRPPVLLSLVPGAAFAVGLDFGHEHIRVAICDLSGELVADDWSPAEVDHAPTESLDLADELVRASLRGAGIAPDRAARRRHGPRGADQPGDGRDRRRGHPPRLARHPPGGRDAGAPRRPRRARERRQRRRPGREGLRRGPRRRRPDLRARLGGHRRRAHPRRPPLPRLPRRRGRDRPCARRSRRPDLPLRQPRLPGDGRQPAWPSPRCSSAAAARRCRSRACSSSSRPATAARGARWPMPARRSAARCRCSSTSSTPSSSSSAATWPRRAGSPRPDPGGDRASRRGARGGRGARHGRDAGRPRRGPRRGRASSSPSRRTPSPRASRSSRAARIRQDLRHGAATQSSPHRVVVVGGGFGGLQACLKLARLPVEVTLVDRRNFHLFQPLAYQVATGAVSPAEICYPLRQHLPPPAQRARRPRRGGRRRPRRAPRRPARRRAGHRARRARVRHADRLGRLGVLLLRPRRVAGARGRAQVARGRADHPPADPRGLRGGRARARPRAPRPRC